MNAVGLSMLDHDRPIDADRPSHFPFWEPVCQAFHDALIFGGIDDHRPVETGIMVADIPVERITANGNKRNLVHSLKAGVQFFLDGWRLAPAMRIMTADPCAVEDVTIGNDAGGLQPLDKR